jgi:hypothetical protein
MLTFEMNAVARAVLILCTVAALLGACVDDTCACSYGENSNGRHRTHRSDEARR